MNDQNQELAREIADLQTGIRDAAEANELPVRFRVEQLQDKPVMRITDTLCGRSTDVPLYAYGQVRAALNELFAADDRVPMNIVRALIEAHNALAFVLRNTDKHTQTDYVRAVGIALAHLGDVMDIIPKDYRPGPEDVGYERGFQAMQDARSCLYHAANDSMYWASSVSQACCELWAAAMNYGRAAGIDEQVFIAPHLAPMG